ncbi:MAG: leucine-rich repeat protein, partial [Eubacterium sp.]
GSELILAVKDTPGCYTMPQGVKKLNSTAFLALGSFTLIPNDNFTVASSVVYDKSGNIVAALPSYKTQVLTVSDNISINDYAFILSEYPQTVRNYCDTLSVGKYSLGYSFNGAFQKNDFTYYGYVDAPAYTYCVENGFAVNLLNAGNCGENAKWYFNTQTKSLKISGSGDMTVYKNAAFVPWHDYIGEIISLEIDDDITALSPYAFYGASAMKSLKMPLSIAAPTSNTVWYSCNAIESIELTLGSGTMPDYGAYNSSKIYTYSPWYISRESIKSFSIDKNVAKIGSYAFRGCDGITSVTLDKCDNIGKYAFYDCKNLTDFTITSKTTTISSNAVFAYSSAAPENICLYAYSDSTAADYAKKMKLNFSSLGCDHTRGYVAEGVRASCCYDCDVSYYCKDCNALIYKEFIKAASNGHHVKGRVVTTEGKAIYDALVYVDGSLAAVTNHFGYFVLDNVLCEVEHTVEIKKHDKTIASTVVNTNKHNRSCTIVIKYGNFLDDNIVNG